MPDFGDGSELEEAGPDSGVYLFVEVQINTTPRFLACGLMQAEKKNCNLDVVFCGYNNHVSKTTVPYCCYQNTTQI